MQSRQRATSCRGRAEGERQGETETKEARRDEERRSDGEIRFEPLVGKCGRVPAKSEFCRHLSHQECTRSNLIRSDPDLIWMVQVSLMSFASEMCRCNRRQDVPPTIRPSVFHTRSLLHSGLPGSAGASTSCDRLKAG